VANIRLCSLCAEAISPLDDCFVIGALVLFAGGAATVAVLAIIISNRRTARIIL
jgi:hypothetical protein